MFLTISPNHLCISVCVFCDDLCSIRFIHISWNRFDKYTYCELLLSNRWIFFLVYMYKHFDRLETYVRIGQLVVLPILNIYIAIKLMIIISIWWIALDYIFLQPQIQQNNSGLTRHRVVRIEIHQDQWKKEKRSQFHFAYHGLHTCFTFFPFIRIPIWINGRPSNDRIQWLRPVVILKWLCDTQFCANIHSNSSHHH